MIEKIGELLSNKNLLAEYWTKTHLDKLKFDFGGVWVRGEECVYIVTSHMNQYSKIEDAFNAVLKKFIFYTLEWNENSYHDMSKDAWVKSFMHTEPKFQLYPDVIYNNVKIEELDFINFKNEILQNVINLDPTKFDAERFSDYKIVKSMAETIISNPQNVKIVTLNSEWNDFFLFGVTDDICFIYNWYTTG